MLSRTSDFLSVFRRLKFLFYLCKFDIVRASAGKNALTFQRVLFPDARGARLKELLEGLFPVVERSLNRFGGERSRRRRARLFGEPVRGANEANFVFIDTILRCCGSGDIDAQASLIERFDIERNDRFFIFQFGISNSCFAFAS